MKKRLLLWFLSCFFVGLTLTSAASIKKTCHYTGVDNQNQMYEVYVDIYSNSEADAYIKQYAGKVENGNSGKGNKEDVQKWNLFVDEYEETGLCPSKVVVNNRMVSGYNVYIGNQNADFSGISGIMLENDTGFSDVIATCNYQTPSESGLSLDFSISLRYDGSVVYSPEHGYTPPSMSVPLVYNINNNNFYNTVYSEGVLNTCPTLSLCVDSGTGFHIQEQTYCATTGENGYALHGQLDNVSDAPEKEDQSRNFCTNRMMSTRTHGDFYFSFGLDANGEKVWSVTSLNGTSSGNVPYNMEITSGTVIFQVDPSLYEVLWNEENGCNTTPLWFKNPYSDQIKYIIVDEAPDSSENGTVDNWDGFDAYQDKPNNQDFSPNTLCTSDNCNISLAEFCYNQNVARTIKFIGLIFFVIKLLVPAIIIVMGIIDLVKVIIASKDDELPKRVKSLGMRVVIGVIIFLLPTIVHAIYTSASDMISNGGRSSFDNCEACLLTPNSDDCIIRDD